EFILRYDKKRRLNPISSFAAVVKGKIDFLGMVKGKEDPSYLRFRSRLRILAPDLVNEVSTTKIQHNVVATVITEGKTDSKHLKPALGKFLERKLFLDLPILFYEYEDEMKAGDKEMLETCKKRAKLPNHEPHIYIFDRDSESTLREVMVNGKPYKNWGNNVFS